MCRKRDAIYCSFKTLKRWIKKIFFRKMPEYLRSPKFSILDAMWTVCPNKQKRGIVIPTTPATTGPEQTKDQQNDWHSLPPKVGRNARKGQRHMTATFSMFVSVVFQTFCKINVFSNIPVCIPILSCSWCSGRCRKRKKNIWLSNSSAMLAISPACLMPFNFGQPLTTTYASPTVST